MTNLITRLCAVVVLAAAASPVAAATPPDLYAALVPVEDASPEARVAAYGPALASVLVRISGARDVASRPEAAPILEQAERFVQQYTYRPGSALWVAFDGAALESALASAGLPVWGRFRPAILVWLAVDEGGGQRRLLGATDDGDVRRQIEAVAAERGLPLIWPLLDSEDLAAATTADVWGGFSDKVRAASRRYGADAVLVARLRSGARTYGTWDFETPSGAERWQGDVAAGMHNVADFLVTRLAAGGGTSDGAIISVRGIRDVAAYGATLSYLRRLSLVESVRVMEVHDDTLLFDLRLRGDAAQLRRAITIGGVLNAGSVDDGVSLNFEYIQ